MKKAYRQNKKKTVSSIVLAVSAKNTYLITSRIIAKAAWDALQSHFERDILANRIYLKKHYFRVVMKDGE